MHSYPFTGLLMIPWFIKEEMEGIQRQAVAIRRMKASTYR